MEQLKHQERHDDDDDESEPQISKEISISDLKSKKRLIFQVDKGHHSHYTAEKYRVDFRHFLDFIRIHDLDVFLDLGKEAIQELVIKYTISLRDNSVKKYSRSTVNTRIAAILYFLDNNDIELNKRKIRRYFPSDESFKEDRPYTVGEIQRILSVCDLRTKAMILLMASAALRIGSLYSMQILDLTPVKISENSQIYKVQVYGRTRDRYFTFCTPECYNAIQEYLEYRKRCGEELKDRGRSPLFRKHFNKDDQFRINLPEFMSEDAVVKIVDEYIKKSGVKTSEVMRTHAFRKGFKSIAERSGLRSINIETLMGHDIGVSGHYYRPSESDLLEDYMKAVDALTIDPSKRLERENQDLKVTQSQEIAMLRAKVQGYEDELSRSVTLDADKYYQLESAVKRLQRIIEGDK